MTRKQRNRIYRKMLELYGGKWLDRHFHRLGFCYLISYELKEADAYENMRKNYPELYNKKPVNGASGTGWWDFNEEGHTIRVMALLEAIKETE